MKCIVIECQNEQKTRGLCQKCYAVARSMINRNKTTEFELIHKGMMSKRKRKGTRVRKSYTSSTLPFVSQFKTSTPKKAKSSIFGWFFS